jgi:aspartate kinase
MRVLKFGGTSVVQPKKCAELVRAQKGPVLVVVSALDGVTEILDEAARAAAAGNRRLVSKHVAELRARHEGPLLDELERILAGLSALGELTPRSRDLVLSFGERLAAPMVAAEIGAPVVESVIVTDEQWGEAAPLREVTAHEAKALAGRTTVTCGFIGRTQHGVWSTLGRGGSDYTATLLAAALGAEEVWLCSDIDGLRAADPRIVPDAAPLAEISFAEALEMVQFGAKGIHPRALEPAAERGIPVRIKNTFRPEAPGTRIGPVAAKSPGSVRSVLLVRDVSLLTVAGAAMVGKRGTAAKIFDTIARAGGNVRMISQSVSESGISIAVARKDADAVRTALEGALVRPGLVGRIVVEEDVGIVAIVGEAMRGTPGVAARLFRAVAAAGINVVAIAQGSSELSISFIVEGAKGPDAVQAAYKEFLG